jgi:hypothetical protein
MLQPLTFKEGEGLGLCILLQVWGRLKFFTDAPAAPTLTQDTGYGTSPVQKQRSTNGGNRETLQGSSAKKTNVQWVGMYVCTQLRT